LSTDLAVTSLGVIVVGRFFEQFVPYTADQAVVQRYFTTKDEGGARRSIWTNAILTIPASFIFFALGTALWVFYRHHPELLIPMTRSDEILPWFIVDQLPPGVSGLVIAGVFAAAMSSLDSSLNSVATTLTTDFYQRFNPQADDRRCLRLAKGITLFLGLLGTGSALYMARLHDTSMMDQNLKVLGLFGGGLAGMFAAGMLSRRITSAGVLVGFFASGAALAAIEYSGRINFLLYAAIGIVTCVVVAVIVSAVELAVRPSEIQP
jgi:Na+/proline symporter